MKKYWHLTTAWCNIDSLHNKRTQCFCSTLAYAKSPAEALLIINKELKVLIDSGSIAEYAIINSETISKAMAIKMSKELNRHIFGKEKSILNKPNDRR